MNHPARLAVLLALLPLLPPICSRANAADALADGPLHQPAHHDDGHAHAHPHIDVAHAIVTESPVPETEIMLPYSFVNTGDGYAHETTASLEYAFVPTFSLELTVPYTLLDPENAGPVGGLGDLELAAKWATYAYADHGFIPAAGLALSLPTGDDELGIGSDHIVELCPFLRAGYICGNLHCVGLAECCIPLNRNSDERAEDPDVTIGYNLALIYHVMPDVQTLIEFHGESAFGGAEGDEHAFYVSPGLTFQPFSDESLNIGLGVSLPITDDREFDYSVNLLTIIHL